MRSVCDVETEGFTSSCPLVRGSQAEWAQVQAGGSMSKESGNSPWASDQRSEIRHIARYTFRNSLRVEYPQRFRGVYRPAYGTEGKKGDSSRRH